jgi:hypothetical protein
MMFVGVGNTATPGRHAVGGDFQISSGARRHAGTIPV